MRKSIDGLMAIVRDTYEMDPFANALYLFCGRKADRIKALHFDQTSFVLLYKRLDNGRFQWSGPFPVSLHPAPVYAGPQRFARKHKTVDAME